MPGTSLTSDQTILNPGWGFDRRSWSSILTPQSSEFQIHAAMISVPYRTLQMVSQELGVICNYTVRQLALRFQRLLLQRLCYHRYSCRYCGPQAQVTGRRAAEAPTNIFYHVCFRFWKSSIMASRSIGRTTARVHDVMQARDEMEASTRV